TGMPIVARIAVKPTPSITKPQRTVDIARMKEVELKLKGRFDPNICPRIVPVAEAMLALVLIDHMLRAGKVDPSRFK
ncbi:MAG: chorismate synthase, partial [Candidatus Hadarchaeaceae archaeon]